MGNEVAFGRQDDQAGVVGGGGVEGAWPITLSQNEVFSSRFHSSVSASVRFEIDF